jgi:type I restriction enzyme R subunit
LEQGKALKNEKHAGKLKPKDELAKLSELIEKLNERFGTEFKDMDKVLQQFVADIEKDEDLRIQARNNSKDHFKFPFNTAFTDIVVDRMTQNKEFCEKILDDEKFGNTIKELLVEYVYHKLRNSNSSTL